MRLSRAWVRKRVRQFFATPESERQQRLARWESNWEVEAARPEEDLSQVLPIEVQDAARTGWFPAGSHVFDIGSGRGQISAWLADQGYTVLGGELTEAGTALARKHFGDDPNIEFRVLDICRATPEPARFDVLLDRGTFHCIPDSWCDAYVRNVATWARPGARFLLMHRLFGYDDTPIERRQRSLDDRIRGQMAPYFDCERSAPTIEAMMRSAGAVPRLTMPGMAFWLTRRS